MSKQAFEAGGTGTEKEIIELLEGIVRILQDIEYYMKGI